MTPQETLSLPIEPGFHGATTIGQYLAVVLKRYYTDNFQFDIYEPLGVSGWKVPIRDALRKAGAIDPESFETDGYLLPALDFLIKADFSTVQEYKEPEDWFVVYLVNDPWDGPQILDRYQEGYTEEKAKLKAAEENEDAGTTRWQAIHIPK